MKLIAAPKIKGLIEAPHPRDLLMWYQMQIDYYKLQIDHKIAMEALSDVEVNNVSEGDILGGNPDGGFKNQKQ